jgi:pimeloyl-ACP methyl ester carboxylesterase
MPRSDPPDRQRRKVLAMTGSVLAGSATARGSSADSKLVKAPALKPGPFVAEVEDMKVYCEVRGTGPLMILVNGMWLESFVDSFSSKFRQVLAKNFTVLTFDQRGQGRTSAGSGSVTYGRFAADTVRLMDVLGIKRANFIGHSDGGCIQLHLLLDFPDRVETATLLGTPYSHEAYRAETRNLFTEWFNQMRRGEESRGWIRNQQPSDPNTPPWWSEVEKRYRAVSPNPERFDEIRHKNRDCWATEPNISTRQLAAINRPVLVVQAGKDEYIPAEQFKVLADNIPKSKLVSYPEMHHNDISPFFEQISKAANDFVRSHISAM